MWKSSDWKKNLFNKKKIHSKIAGLYSAYGVSVKRMWEQIYSNSNEFDLVMTRLSAIQNGKHALEKESDIGYIVEQFFSMCFFAVSALGAYYEGVLAKKESDLVHDGAIKLMNEKMDLLESKYGIKRID